ncbi:MAG: DegT/DnrJ/EryC1/StrS family aminotransferase [bacterium]
MSATEKKTPSGEIPLVDLKAQYRAIRDEVRTAIDGVLEDTAFIGGKRLQDFQDEFARFAGARFALGASSGTSALHLALIACGVKPGDEVITVPNTFIATTEAITQAGGKIRFVDADAERFTMDPVRLAEAITARTKVVLPVQLFGQSADLEPILAAAKEHGAKVVEDAAQSHGAQYKGRPSGSLGDIAAFSFYPGKNLGAYGDGGIVTTNDESMANTVRLLLDHGRTSKYEHSAEGFNYRLDTLQAAILRVKLRHLNAWNDARRRVAAAYNERLAGIDGLLLPREFADGKHVYHIYAVRTERRDALKDHLAAAGIAAGVHYPIPLHLQPAYRHLGIPKGSFPVAETLAATFLSLPVYPEMGEREIDAVATAVRGFFERT